MYYILYAILYYIMSYIIYYILYTKCYILDTMYCILYYTPPCPPEVCEGLPPPSADPPAAAAQDPCVFSMFIM